MSSTAIFIGLLIALISAPYWLERNRVPVDKRYRSAAPGQFARLSQGITHYQWHGAARGPVLVAIHGLTTPSKVWENLATDFGRLGFRVLTYDLYGRGFSDAVKGEQDADFFATQLDDLLQSQGIDQNVSLLGYSMGGSIAISYAAKNTHRVDRLFLIASAGFDITECRFSNFCRRVPLIGDWVHDVFAGRRLQKSVLAETNASEIAGLSQAQLAEPNRQGFLRSVLSSRRGMLAETLEQDVRTLAKRNIPTLAVWGRDDPVIPVSSVSQLDEWHPDARQKVIDGADHAITYTHGDFVFDAFETLMAEDD